MRSSADAEVFISKGVNGRWRDTPLAQDSTTYEARASTELGEDCARRLLTRQESG